MSTGTLCRGILTAVLLFAATAIPAQAQGRNITQPVVFEQAEYVRSNALRPPPDDAPWQTVRLPDDWHASQPGYSGNGWYRIALPPMAAPWGPHVIYLPRDSADLIRIFLNGRLIGSTQRPDPHLRLHQQPYLTGINAAALHENGNVLHIMVAGHGDLHHGLPRVWFGDSVLVRKMWVEKHRLNVLLPLGFAFAVLVIGCIALVIWVKNRHDRQFLWIGLAATLLGAPTALQLLAGPSPSGVNRDLLQLLYCYAAAPALAISGLHMARIKQPVLAWVLWLILAAGCLALYAMGSPALVKVSIAMGTFFLSSLLVVFALVLARSDDQRTSVRIAMAAGFAAVIGFAVHDLSIWMGWIDFDRITLSVFSAPVLTLSLGVLLITRYLDAVRGLATVNATLEQRIAERTAEIEQTHQRLHALEQERIRIAERQRIMADIHDGLGASLVSLLSVVQSRNATPEDIERRVHDALVELRLAVDSQDTPEGDLLTALATIRFRMRDALEASGIELDWDVTDVPPLDQLSSANLLGIQRIVLEALTNAIRHAHAKRVTVSLASADGHVVVFIVDDGRGFDAAALSRAGRGLASMRRRADDAGGSLRIESAPGRGTRVILTLPTQPQNPAA